MRRRDFVASMPALVAVASCGGDDGPMGPAPVPGARVTVFVEDDAFVDPDGNRNAGAVVTINAGETVGWRQSGVNPHTATSTSVPGGAQGFDSGTMREGDTYTVTPTVPGTYVYQCDLHPAIMLDARIIVR